MRPPPRLIIPSGSRARGHRAEAAAGKYADLIAVGGDPLRHIDVLRDPKLIIRHGRRFK